MVRKMSKKNEVKNEVDLNLEGLDKNAAITALINSGLDFKAANKYWVENRDERGTGFKARFYALLGEGEMSEKTFEDLIALESKNVIAHKSAHNAVRELANLIWSA